jgi:dephospho-CoA kinase
VTGATPTTGRRRGGRPIRIGLTGPIGCGKSTVAGWLAELGAVVVDADALARDVLAPGTPETAAVVDHFGERVARDDGSVDRGALAAIVFADPAALADLEAIVHPAVRPQVLAAIDAADVDGAQAVVIEAIKLVEGGLAALCDEVWLVTCDPEAQRQRVVARGMAAEDADRRIAAQAGSAERLAAAATRILDTTGAASDARARVVDAWHAATD